MTRIELISQFLLKARAWDAQEEQAADLKDRRTRYTRLSVFDVHAMIHLAQRGTCTAADTHIERRQFMRSAETAKAELNSLADRGYLDRVGNTYRLAPKGVEFVNSVMT